MSLVVLLGTRSEKALVQVLLQLLLLGVGRRQGGLVG